MQLGAYEIAIIGVGGAIVGALLGAWLGYRFSLSLFQLTSRCEAAAKFRAAFKDELLALDIALTMNAPDTCVLLTSAFNKHRSAVFDFKHSLGADAERFEQAWQEYYRYPDAPDWTVPILEQYSGEGCSISEAKQRKLLAVERIERLLSFAHNL